MKKRTRPEKPSVVNHRNLELAQQLATKGLVNELAEILVTGVLNYLSDSQQREMFIAAARKKLAVFEANTARGIYPAGADKNPELAEYLTQHPRAERARILQIIMNPDGIPLQVQLVGLGYARPDPRSSQPNR